MSKFCSNCGEKVKETSKFCPECGYDLEKTSNIIKKNSKNKSKKNKIIIGLLIMVIVLVAIFALFLSQTSAETHEIQFVRQGFVFNVSNDYETNNTYDVDTVSMDVLFQANGRDFHVYMAGTKYLDELSSYTSNSNGWEQLDDLTTLDNNTAHIFKSRSGGGYACFIENPGYDESLDNFEVNTYKYVYVGTSDYDDAVTIIESFHWVDNTVNASMNSTSHASTSNNNDNNQNSNSASDPRDLNGDGVIDEDESNTNDHDGIWEDENDNPLPWLCYFILNYPNFII